MKLSILLWKIQSISETSIGTKLNVGMTTSLLEACCCDVPIGVGVGSIGVGVVPTNVWFVVGVGDVSFVPIGVVCGVVVCIGVVAGVIVSIGVVS